MKKSFIFKISNEIFCNLLPNLNYDPGLFYRDKRANFQGLIGRLCRFLIILLYVINDRLLAKVMKLQTSWGAHDQAVKILLGMELNKPKLEIDNLLRELILKKINFANGSGYSTPFNFDGKKDLKVSYAHTCCWAFDAYYEAYKNGFDLVGVELNQIIHHLAKDFRYTFFDNGSCSINYSFPDGHDLILNVAADVALVFEKWSRLNICIDENLVCLVNRLTKGLMKFVDENIGIDGLIVYKAGEYNSLKIDPYHSLMILRVLTFFNVNSENYVDESKCLRVAYYIREFLFEKNGDPRGSLRRKYPMDSYAYAELLRLLNESSGTNLGVRYQIIFETCFKRFKYKWVSSSRARFVTKKYYF